LTKVGRKDAKIVPFAHILRSCALCRTNLTTVYFFHTRTQSITNNDFSATQISKLFVNQQLRTSRRKFYQKIQSKLNRSTLSLKLASTTDLRMKQHYRRHVFFLLIINSLLVFLSDADLNAPQSNPPRT
jgi:recombinational DNA repair protein (RecF pathway)